MVFKFKTGKTINKVLAGAGIVSKAKLSKALLLMALAGLNLWLALHLPCFLGLHRVLLH